MSLIKDIYSLAFFNRFISSATKVIPSFDSDGFLTDVMGNGFEQLEWKQRMKHVTATLHNYLPSRFPETALIFPQLITQLQADNEDKDQLAFMFLPDYVETYGIDDFDNAIPIFEQLTQFISCEFAVRPFILKYEQKMLNQMKAWSTHPNYKVRRLASEGARPRLPWAMAIPFLKKDPSPILPIIENMINDESEWVRKSVANNINDISKDHPLVVIQLAHRWKNHHKNTDGIIKHGCRTLLKAGNTEILNYYGLGSDNIEVTDFNILTPIVKIGDSLTFSFNVVNNNPEDKLIRLEYAIYYKRLKDFGRKVFKISEKKYEANSATSITRNQSFKVITTRKYYEGLHKVAIIINGKEQNLDNFELLKPKT